MLATNCSIVPVPPSKTNPLIQQRVFCFQPVESCSVPQFSHPNEVRHDYQAPVPLALEPTRYFRFSCCRTAGLADCHENINRDGNPDVRLHRILGSTVEFFDPNTLFDLSFDLSKEQSRSIRPTAPPNFCLGQWPSRSTHHQVHQPDRLFNCKTALPDAYPFSDFRHSCFLKAEIALRTLNAKTNGFTS